MVEVGTG